MKIVDRSVSEITLISVVGGYYEQLEYMLSHYKSMGVDSIVINIVGAHFNDDCLTAIPAILNKHEATVDFVTVAPWFEAINPVLYRLSRVKRGDRWFILADVDELQIYPDTLEEVFGYCDKKGYTYIEGCLVDRVAEDGRLGRIREGEPIWDQFPVGTFLTGPILGGVVNKIVAVKGTANIGPGQHHAHSGVGCPPSELYIPVYHFKWTNGLLDRLSSRVANQTMLGETVRRESMAFKAYYEKHGRIVLEDPRLLAGRCIPHYPHWERIREWRVASWCFRRF